MTLLRRSPRLVVQSTKQMRKINITQLFRNPVVISMYVFLSFIIVRLSCGSKKAEEFGYPAARALAGIRPARFLGPRGPIAILIGHPGHPPGATQRPMDPWYHGRRSSPWSSTGSHLETQRVRRGPQTQVAMDRVQPQGAGAQGSHWRKEGSRDSQGGDSERVQGHVLFSS